MNGFIGIIAEDRPALLIGLLGILKSGNSFVPINPTFPKDRINYIISDCDITIILTDRANYETAREIAEINLLVEHIVCIDDVANGEKNIGLRKNNEQKDVDGTCYVIYTSGSTGKPKGVPITHRHLIPEFCWFRDYMGLDRRNRVMQNLSYTFDFGVFEIFTTLLFGSSLYVVDKKKVGDFGLYSRFINMHFIDTAHSTPVFFNSVVSLGEKMPSLRLVHLGGERLTGNVVKKISAKVSPGCKIHNGYGPTETTINCSIYTLTASQCESIDDSANIPIGQPTVLHRLYILDRNLRPLPEGIAGELCIAGAGLAPGYLNNPELTTEKFQFNWSYGSYKTSILYKTGDLARWLRDGPPAGGTAQGVIEFLGRIDHQVKIRGYRIELGEIESCLLKHPGIKEAVIIIGGHESGGNYLCAYFVSNSTIGITVTMLREYLAKELPAYMIPAYFVRMERMPLTANGKVDKKSLPAPDESDIETGSAYEAPVTALEKRLVKIWQELLRIDRIGIKDDFFELGGDSILVNRCIAAIRTELNVEIPMRKFFERPYINALAEEIEKQERQVSSIKPVERIGEIPLSFAQERLWFLQELDTGNVAYFVPRVIRMKGYLDVSLLERTFTEIIRRHEILHTVFPTIDGQPVQRIQPPFPFKIPVLDWSGLKKEEQELRVSHFLSEENRRPFDFEKGPLLRVTILKLNEEEHLFVLTEHHLVHDGWTQGVLLNEIITIFSAYLEGRNHNLPELPIQYADYTIWERSYLQGERLKRHLDYWLEKLSGLIPVLELPVDRPRSAVISGQGALNVFRISSTLTDQLREFSRENGTTLFVTMLAAFKVLLYRYTGVNDICVGTGIANRGRKEMENMLGMVINSLPLRTHTPGDIPFRQYLLHVKETCLEGYQRQDTPFGKIVEALGQERSLSYSPVFQVMLSFMDTPTEELHLPGLELHQEETHNHSAKFDLDLVVVPPMQREGGMAVEINEGEILVEWEYNTDIFEAETIARMIRHYIRLLEVIVLQSDVSIANLPMLGEDELKRILYEWNDTEADYPRGKTVHDLFEEQAAKTPDHIAICGHGQTRTARTNTNNNVGVDSQICPITLSYNELNEQSARLAMLLIDKGVLPDTIVAIMMEHSIEMIIGLLGILKSGGAYLPIDSEYPQERINYMLKDSGVKILINEKFSRGTRAARRGEPIRVFQKSHPGNLAYIIYTSGSTGRPKGVMIEHKSFTDFSTWAVEEFEHRVGYQVLLSNSYASDGSIQQIFPPLISGGVLHVIKKELRLDVARYLDYLRTRRINNIDEVPVLMKELVALIDPDDPEEKLPDLTCLSLGSEYVPIELVKKCRRHLNHHGRIINAYGPAEASVETTTYHCDGTLDNEREQSLIGKPRRNIQVYILDAMEHCCPIGVRGEICVSGVGLARGYLNQPELTAEKFNRSYWSYKAYALYRTGDCGCWLPDGNIRFFGRIDDQIKIRGYRIELQEIEKVLKSHKEVKDAVVLSRENPTTGEIEICAYYVPGSDTKPSLLEYIEERLPSYMTPSYLMELEKIPLTPNGKVDKNALPEPKASSTGNYLAPRNEIEKKLVDIWCEVLNRSPETIGVHTDFFKVGGHSLKVAVLTSRIKKQFEIEIPIIQVFKTPTIVGLAQYLKTAGKSAYTAIEPVELKEYYDLTPVQKRLYILQQMEPSSPAYNVPAFMPLDKSISKERLTEIFKRIIQRHEILRTSYEILHEEPRQKIHDVVEFEIEFKNASTDYTDYTYGRGDPLWSPFIRPFDLSKAPLVRVGLLKELEDKYILAVDMHHIICDPVSHEVLLGEFNALCNGEELPGLKLQYKDYAGWQNSELQQAKVKQQGNYWLNLLSGDLPELELPVDFSRPQMQSFEGDSVDFILGREETQRLKNTAQHLNATDFMIILAVLNILLSKLSSQEDIIVGTPISMRQHEDIEKMIGMFINTLALRNEPVGNKTFNNFLQELKINTLAAYSNADYPFEELVDKIVVSRNTSRNPIFDVMFNYLREPVAPTEADGKPIYEKKTAKFDLTLTVVEVEGKLLSAFEYCTKLFGKATIERFLVYFKNIVRSILENEDVRICDLEILGEDEKNRILFEFNDTGKEYFKDKTIHRLFVEQVAKVPDQIAIVGAGSQTCPIALSYNKLNEQSDRLAGLLIEKGVQEDTIVGMMIERSVEMIVGIMGILKAGCAYLPIDPDTPQERIQYMLEDSHAKILLLMEEFQKKIIVNCQLLIINGKLKAQPQALSHHSSIINHHSSQLAYVIYTSGSTGKPKGVMINHRSVVNFIKGVTDIIPFMANDRVLSLTTISFDIFGLETLVPLVSGSVVVMGGRAEQLYPDAAGIVMKRENISIFQVTPSRLQMIIALPEEAAKLKILKYLLVGGEAFPGTLLEKVRPFVPGKIFNMYGPTETTIWSTVKEVSAGTAAALNIGRPIANTVIYILDGWQSMVPIGVPGELYIAGDGLARGYLNQPELANKSFVGVKGGLFQKPPLVVYKTGDLARWLWDGNIDFIGRIDNQVKIRGFRIELGEIEHQLLSHDDITASAVIVMAENGENYLCAYFTSDKPVEIAVLRDGLAKKLPHYMIPSYFIRIESMPLTKSGKVDRKALSMIGRKTNAEKELVAPQNETENIVAEVWKEVLGLDQVGIYDNFFNVGGNSLKLIRLNAKLNTVLGTNIPAAKLFEHVTINAFARYFTEKEAGEISSVRINAKSMTETHKFDRMADEIAIIGMAGRFPGARNIDEFWTNLKNGIESITFMTDEELLESGIDTELIRNPNYVKSRGGVLEDKDCFDATFFDYTASEALLMDPQTRIFHECAWEALENAGYNPYNYEGSMGVYAGASASSSWEGLTYLSGKSEKMGSFAAMQLANKDFMCSRIAYKLDLKGPAVNIQTTCSTSLVAVHMAYRAILGGDCDMALAGGVSLAAEQPMGYLYQEGMILSPDGHCRAFDAESKGTVGGYGAGIVVLKPLLGALKDGDNIHAIIRGTAINNDGLGKAGYTAPSVKGQAAVIQTALQRAKVNPEIVTYVETHGTGTILGDPIEIEALKQAFNTDKKQYCAIGSVKTNIGHLDAAAGIAGLIKTVLALKHKLIPPSLHYKKANPKIDFENSPFYVNSLPREWKNEKNPRLAGVSSLGLGGTNAHVVLEEAPVIKHGENNGIPHLILLSARSESALEKITGNLGEFLQKNSGMNLGDAAYTLQVGRNSFDYKRMLVCDNIDGAVQALSSLPAGQVKTSFSKAKNPPVIFMFPGQGAQYVNMGFELYQNIPLFRSEMDRCFELLKPSMKFDLKEILYPAGTGAESSQSELPGVSCTINHTEITQPVIFTLEYALAKLLMAWGIKPYAMIGHSIGEYTAACLAGVFSLEDALTLVSARGRLVKQTPGGAMLSVPLARNELEPLLNPELSLAAVNGPSLCVVSGAHEAIHVFEKQLKEKGYDCTRLHTSHAFHSRMMDPVLKEFERLVSRIRLNKPVLPYISNVTGNWITVQDVKDPAYWSAHLRKTVRFEDGLSELLKTQNAIYVEVGPGKSLSTFVRQHKNKEAAQSILNLVRHPRENVPDLNYLLDRIGQMWLNGGEIDWRQFYAGERRIRIPLPTYPFEKNRYRLEGSLSNLGQAGNLYSDRGNTEAMDAIRDIERREPGLAAPKHTRPKVSADYVPPQTEIEKQLAGFYEELLGLEQVGVNDDFFELGGDSLKAVTVIARIHKELNKTVSMGEFFNRPTIRELAEYIQGSEQSDYYSIKSIEKKEYYFQSSSQRRLYFLQQMDKGGTAYNLSEAWILEGIVDKDRLEQAIRGLIRRHESLRTSIEEIAEEPFQRVHDHVEFEIEYKNSSTDYTDYPDEEIHHSSFIIHHFIRAFDLSKAPLLRVGLVKIAEARYIFLVDIHHIISDGTSIQVLVQDFLALYAGKELPEIKLQYKDYAEWQNRERGSKMIQEQSEYWKKEFEGEIPVLELPLDYARPAVQGFEGNTIDFEFSNETTGALKSLALETGSTLYIVLLSLYNILLSRLSNQEDIVIGSPVAARRHADLEKIIGMFVNTLALRYFPVEEKKYVDFLEEVKEKTLKGLENQEYQYEDLVENVAVARDVSRNPLFDTMFTLQNTGTQKLEIPNLKLTPYKFENQTAKFDLELTGVEIKDKLLFELEYSTKLFKRETVERFILYFKNLANGISENKERKICDLEIFAEEEKRRILFEFNDTEAEYPEDKIISQLFEAQVSKTPDHVAVVGAGSQTCPIALSYNKLNEQSDRLAGLLNEKGVLADSIVGIMMERSVEMIIGIMGIFKAGGAYLPIDPDYPQERIDYMLNDSRAKILLAMEESRKKIIINCQLLIVNYELLSSAPQAPFHHSSFIIYHSKQLAYIIYTSGTTGKPKGAMIEHRGMVNHIYAKIHDLQLDNRSVVAQNASQMFDISVWQFFAALIIGGRTVIIPNEIIREPMNFMAHILDSKITILEVVPSYLAALLDIPSGENSYSSLPLQYLLVTGEAVNPGLLKKWFSKYPGIKVVNAYGPTEASDDITHHIMDKAPEMNQVPIGSPVQNMKISIVDKYMVLCPLGVPGELYVAGAGIGRGYLNRPQLTAEKFFKHRSHRSYKTHILYKTGDLARWLNDGPPAGGTTKGIIEFLGRIDHQVKIRGFRIELGEIETQLVKHVDIKEAVVIAREEETGNKYLCAYVVSNKEFKIADLREHLVKELPDYMVPAYFVAMEKIPLTPNGKVDRKALPIPGINAGEEYIGPRDEAEKGVLYIVADILGINPAKISVRANFFNLGLNSITILKIAHRISDEFKINFPIGTLFTSPSVEGVAADMKKGYYPGASRRAVLLNRGKADKNLFLISGDGAIYIFKELALLLEDRFNVYGIQGKGIMDTGKLPETRQELYEDFIEEIKLVQPEGPYLVGGHCFGAIIAYEVTRILEERKNKITKLVMLDHHAVTRDYVFNFIIFFRCFNKCRNALLALKKAAKSAQAKLSREGHSDMQNENDNNRGVIPEDLEARRLEVERNYRYIINQLWIYSRIVKAPVLVLKSDESVHDPDPRWDPNTIAKMSKTSVKQVRTPGEHYSMFENPHLPVLAKLLLELI